MVSVCNCGAFPVASLWTLRAGVCCVDPPWCGHVLSSRDHVSQRSPSFYSTFFSGFLYSRSQKCVTDCFISSIHVNSSPASVFFFVSCLSWPAFLRLVHYPDALHQEPGLLCPCGAPVCPGLQLQLLPLHLLSPQKVSQSCSWPNLSLSRVTKSAGPGCLQSLASKHNWLTCRLISSMMHSRGQKHVPALPRWPNINMASQCECSSPGRLQGHTPVEQAGQFLPSGWCWRRIQQNQISVFACISHCFLGKHGMGRLAVTSYSVLLWVKIPVSAWCIFAPLIQAFDANSTF